MTSRILLADDSITIQKVVNLTFADEGIEVVAVSNGELAERRLSEINPDLVLADIFMPGKNGYELCEYVKQSPQYRNIPVILLVGAFEPFNEVEARRVRADAHLTKPFESRTLVDTVRKLIGKSGRPASEPANSQPARAQDQEKVAVAPASEASSASPPPFNLDLSAMTPEWQPSAGSTPETNSFATVSTDAHVSEPSPLELDYGAFGRTDTAPAAFQMQSEESASDTGFSFVNSVKDTAELPQIEGVTEPPSNDRWSHEAAPFQAQTSFSDSPVPTLETEQTFDTFDAPMHMPGFKVESTFTPRSENVELDFEKLDAPAPSVPDNIVSFDVDFSTFSTTPAEPAQPEPPATQSFEVGSLPQSGFETPTSESVRSHDEAEFGHVSETTGQALQMDDPLGDVFSMDARQPQTETVFEAAPPIEFVESDPADSLSAPVSQFGEVSEPISHPAFDVSEASSSMPFQDASGDRLGGVVHSGLSFEAFSPVLEEPSYEQDDASRWSQPASSIETAAIESLPSVTEPILEPPVKSSVPEPGFISSEMWAGEDAKFAAVDIDAVSVDEGQPSVHFEDSIDAETGFAFASVAEAAVEEPEPAPVASYTAPPPPPVVDVAAPADELPSGPMNLSPAIIDEIVRRVVAELGDAVVREIAWEVVPDCVERVVEKLTQEAAAKRM